MIIRGAKIGKNITIGHNVNIFGKAVIGNGVKIEGNTDIWNGVTLKDDVFVGPGATFTNDLTPRAYASKKGKYIKTLVKRGASIGANSTIICGNTIGEYSCVGAGSVVTKSVPPHTVVVGNPARVLRKLKTTNNKWL